MARATTRRTLLLLMTWSAVVVHCCVCKVALASLTRDSRHECCGTWQGNGAGGNACGEGETCAGCPACATVSPPKPLVAETPTLLPAVDRFHSPLSSLVDPAKASPPARFVPLDAPPLKSLLADSLDRCPNAPPRRSRG